MRALSKLLTAQSDDGTQYVPKHLADLLTSDMYSVIQKDGLNFVRLHFLKYTWYVNDLHNI